MQTAVPLLGCFLIIILQCVQADVYVKANSTCGSSCDGSVTNPWPTIAQGIQAVYSVGGTVIMNPGIYTGPGNFDLIITNSAAVVLESSTGNPADVVVNCANEGPGFMIQNTGPVTMQGFTIENCARVNASGSAIPSVCGGALSITGVNTVLTSMNFIDNSVLGNGGAICVYSAVLTISNSLFQNSAATGAGGALFIESATVNITNTTFSGSRAPTGVDVFCNQAKIAIDGRTNLASKGTSNCNSCPIMLVEGPTHALVCSDPHGGTSAGMLILPSTWYSSLVLWFAALFSKLVL